MIVLREALRIAGLRLKESGSPTPALDAAVLLGYVTGCRRAELYRNWLHHLPPEEENRYFKLIDRRAAGEPVAYLVGHKEFMGLKFAVNPDVLIPRPETELLVERAMALLGEKAGIAVDVGTGSGAIAVSLAVNLPRLMVYATDLSTRALAVACQNAAWHNVGRRIFFLSGDLLMPLAGQGLSGQVDLIAANLPYIATNELPGLPRDVRRYEPRTSLDGGADGLDLYRRLIVGAVNLIKPGGNLLLEIGPGQRAGAAAMLCPPVWTVRFEQDLAGLDRLVVASKKG